MLIVVAPASMAVWTARQRKSRSLRVASSGDHCTSSTRLRAWETELSIWASTWSRDILSLCSMWMSEVAMKVWMRLCGA